MRRLAALFERLDRTTATSEKVAALVDYFRAAPPGDAAWAVLLLSGGRLKRLFAPALIRQAGLELSGLPAWLFDECYQATGDLAEALALLIEEGPRVEGGAEPPPARSLQEWVEGQLLPLVHEPDAVKVQRLAAWRRQLAPTEVFLLVKLLTGELRVGVSQRLVVQALARVAELDAAVIAARLAGRWDPTPEAFSALVAPEGAGGDEPARPYPFFLASPSDDPPGELGEPSAWLMEWKWDGIRAQLLRRDGVALWSRGDEVLTERFPEVTEAAASLPEGCVLDGELLAFRGDRPLPFALLQRRIGRKTLTRRVLREAPAAFLAFDLLEVDGQDLRPRPLEERRARLEALLASAPAALRLSEALLAPTWEAAARLREEAREAGAEGLMLKRLGSPYRVGRRRGDWWKWKVDPYTVDAVLTHAQPGHGRRAALLSDYTFSVWHEGALVPVAKAYSGLDDAELQELDRWLRRHTRARYGPVREVEPTQVFELAFEGIRRSTRHRSGVAVRFPRIARWRTDKPASEADALETLQALIPDEPPPPPPERDGPEQLTLFDGA